jgi:autotransporter-associated beta strand protein
MRGALFRLLALGVSPAALTIAATSEAESQTIGSGQTVQASSLGTGTAAFQGGTLVVDKTATFSSNFTLAEATATVLANTIDAHGNAGTFSGIFSDAVTGLSGPLTVTDTVGGGQVVLTGANTYSGATTINAGATLAMSGTGTILLSKSVQDNGTFDISAATQPVNIISLGGSGSVVLGAQGLKITGGVDTFTGTISGSGSLTVTGGTQILDGTNSYTGGTTITSGAALVIGNADTNGSIRGDVSNSGVFEFNRTDSIIFSQTISGSGNVIQTGGTVTFKTPQTYTGLTTITAGTLVLSGNGGIASSSSLSVGGTFDISATNGASITSLAGAGTVTLGAATLTITGGNGTFSGVIAGSGGLTVTGGTQILTGANSYTGATTIAGGTLQLGNGTTTGSVTGNIADAGTLAFNYSGSQTFSAVISGSGQVKLLGGTLTVTAPQTYTGTTTINAGTLVLAGTGSLASSQGVADNGSLDVSGISNPSIQSLSGTGTVQLGAQSLTISNAQGSFSGVILGTGGVTVTGGTQNFGGSNLYTGPTLIAGGTLAVSNISALATTNVTDNGVLDISTASNAIGNSTIVTIPTLSGSGSVVLGNRTLTLTAAVDSFSGNISGAGNVTVASGTETFTGASSYTGTTTIASPATLALSGNGALSASTTVAVAGIFDISAATADATVGSLSGAGTVALGARNLIVAAGRSDFSGTISGSGGLVVSGGTQILSGLNTYTGGTSITGGTLQLGDGTGTGSLLGNVADAGTLAFDYAGQVAFNGVISGSGGVSQIGSGTIILTGANSYTGGTTIYGGGLQIGNGGTAGSLAGDVTDNASLVFDRSDTVTFNGAISGIGSVSQIGSGTLILGGANSYTGATTIASGSTLLLASANAIATSSSIVDNGLLDVSAVALPQISALAGSGAVALGAQTLSITAGAGAFSGAIAGTGGVTVTGGSQTLAGTNTYTGPTSIAGGTLSVTGSIASSSGVSVGSGGTLAGTGTAPAVTVASGGTLAPGVNGSGTLTASSVSFASGSNFLVNVSSKGAPALAVSGTAQLGGTLSVASVDGTYLLGQKLTVLSAAGGITGNFTAAAIASKGAQFSSTISTDPNNVFLTINLAKLSPLLPGAVSRNQANAVAGIDAGLAHGSVPTAAFNGLANLSSDGLAADASQLAGELGADLVQAGNAIYAPYQDAVFAHLGDMRLGGSVRRVRLESQPTGWAAVFGGNQVVTGDVADGSQKLSSSAVGFVAGMDWPVSPKLLLGGALTFGSAHFHAANGLGNGRTDSYALGAYGLVQYTPRIYGAFFGTVGQDSITTNRTVTAQGTDVLAGSPTDLFLGARYETGIDLKWIVPYLAAEDRLVALPAYAETASSGSADFALNYASHNSNMPGVELGVRNSFAGALGRNWSLRFSDRLAWMHDFNTSYVAMASYAALSGSQFTSFGAQPGRDFALFSLDAEARNRSGMMFGVGLETSVSHQSQSYYGIGRFGFTW